MAMNDWPYPGARWWKFDFHTHTPASTDTPWLMQHLDLSPKQWLLKYMAAGIDCVAVTDHNSGAWIDLLKDTYAQMQAQSDAGEPPDGFRSLTIFPGVEISTQGGVHVLAILDPGATTGDIDTLLGKVDYQGTKGDSDGVTVKGIADVIQTILAVGAIPIPAHADQAKGLLQCKPGSSGSALDANTIRQAMAVEGLLGVEWCDMQLPWPECVAKDRSRFARVLGSDGHSFQDAAIPGSRYTWVKIAKPTLEGLRLALLDGNGVSIRRSDEDAFDPFKTPAHVITSIEIDKARYMGNGQTARLECSPYFNAIVGGRGTGKSTVVHALRLATRRGDELVHLGEESEPRRRFEEFCKIAKARDDEGALRQESEIRVVWQYDDVYLLLRWRAGGDGVAVETWDEGQWRESSSQSINVERFPLRIFSQGQIAAMAGSGRQALLSIIDEAAQVSPIQQALDEAKRTFFAQRARLRELDGKLAVRPEVERKRDETSRKLAAFAQSDHAVVLSAYAIAQRQQREVDLAREQLAALPDRVDTLAAEFALDDWPPQYFTEADGDILDWRSRVDLAVAEAATQLRDAATQLRVSVQAFEADPKLSAWRERAAQAQAAHEALQQRMAEQGVDDPQAFGRLTQERQQLEAQVKDLDRLQEDRDRLAQDIDAQHTLLSERRRAITAARADFVTRTLASDDFVRIEVRPFGHDPRVIERQLRELIDVPDERFAEDILNSDNGEPTGGLAFHLANATDKEAALETGKARLIDCSPDFGGRFRNYLQRRGEKPEFADHVLTWFPEDDLHIEYKRNNHWHPLSQGSQGQRSAALLAFLLAFGEEPIILDQPEDDLDNHLIYDLIVRQIRENKLRRQLIVVTHNPNVVVNGDAELVHVMEFGQGQCFVQQSGALQDRSVREEVCRVMEGGHEAFARRWKRLGTGV